MYRNTPRYIPLVTLLLVTLSTSACFDPNIIPPEETEQQNNDSNSPNTNKDEEENPGNEHQNPTQNTNPEEVKVKPYNPTWQGPTPPKVCGNGTVDDSEGCDDGNKTDGDGCSSECQIEEDTVCSNEAQFKGEANILLTFKGYTNTEPLDIKCLNKKGVVSKYLNEQGFPFLTAKTCTGNNAESDIKKFSTIFSNTSVPTVSYVYSEKYSDTSDTDALSDLKAISPFYKWYSEKRTDDYTPARFDKSKLNDEETLPYHTMITRIRFKYDKNTKKIGFAGKGSLYLYINNILAVDKPIPATALNTINLKGEVNETTHRYENKNYNLVEGGVYEISIFYVFKTPREKDEIAIDNPTGIIGPSLCQKCGDGIIFSIGENSDDDETCDLKDVPANICDSNCRVTNGYTCYQDYDRRPVCVKK